MYPNPGTGIYHLQYGDYPFRIARLFDISGREVKSFALNPGAISINLQEQNPGIYLLQLFDSADQPVYTLKIMHASF
jgi:hypothetical protein